MEVAANGLGRAGDVMIPLTVWERLVLEEAVRAMRSVEVPTKDSPQAELAMVRALEEQGHLVPINENLPGCMGYATQCTYICDSEDGREMLFYFQL